MKTALIIGSEGQDGQLLAELLLNKGYRVHGVDKVEDSNSQDVQYSPIDLGNPRLIKSCLSQEFDEIYYLAAYHHSSGNKALEEAGLIENSYAVNVLSFAILLETLVKQNAKTKVFYAGSSLIYGASGTVSQDEDTNPKPNCIYSITKKSAMDLADYYRVNHRLFIGIGILYNHESIYRGDEFLSKKLVSQAREVVAGERMKIVVGDLNAETDWGYAPDYVNAMWHILQLKEGQNYIVSSGKLHKVLDWVQILFEHLNLNWKEYVEEDPGLIFRKKPKLTGNNAKITATGWKPRTSFEQMVVKMYENRI